MKKRSGYWATAEKEETLMRLKEFEFLLLDTTGKDPNYVRLINLEKDRINEKYGLEKRQE